jgi:hypothetical protein
MTTHHYYIYAAFIEIWQGDTEKKSIEMNVMEI